MARMSTNAESPRINCGYRSQLTYWILDAGATCHITPEISDFILGSLVETDQYIKVAVRNFLTAKKIGEVQIDIRDNNGKTFIDTLYNVLFAPDFFNWLFSIIALINSVRTFLFHKWFCTFFFSDHKQNAVTIPHRTQRKHAL